MATQLKNYLLQLKKEKPTITFLIPWQTNRFSGKMLLLQKLNFQASCPRSYSTLSVDKKAVLPSALLVNKSKTKIATIKQSPLTSSINKKRNKLPKNKTVTKKGFRTGFRKPAPLPKNPNLFCLISINRTKNNTHATISNLFGENKTKWSISAGQLKLSGSRRKTRLSQRMIYKSCLEKALSFGYKFSVIHCKGSRGSKVRIFRSFGDSLSVLLIKDTTGAPHNGCRPPKVRRV